MPDASERTTARGALPYSQRELRELARQPHMGRQGATIQRLLATLRQFYAEAKTKDAKLAEAERKATDLMNAIKAYKIPQPLVEVAPEPTAPSGETLVCGFTLAELEQIGPHVAAFARAYVDYRKHGRPRKRSGPLRIYEEQI